MRRKVSLQITCKLKRFPNCFSSFVGAQTSFCFFSQYLPRACAWADFLRTFCHCLMGMICVEYDRRRILDARSLKALRDTTRTGKHKKCLQPLRHDLTCFAIADEVNTGLSKTLKLFNTVHLKLDMMPSPYSVLLYIVLLSAQNDLSRDGRYTETSLYQI